MSKYIETEAGKQAAREWYGSCTLEELLNIKERLDFVITERMEQVYESHEQGQT